MSHSHYRERSVTEAEDRLLGHLTENEIDPALLHDRLERPRPRRRRRIIHPGVMP